MAGVTIRNLDYLQRKDQRLYEALTDIQRALVPQSQDPPPAVTAISVASLGNGSVDVTIADGGAVNQGVNYWVEHADNPNFLNARPEDFGGSRTGVIAIGSGTRYFRAYSQYRYPWSLPNSPVVFGGFGNPTGVVGGGTATPILQPSTGSGTGSTNGQQASWGFGKIRVRAA
jgi:hypothetical protein